MVTTWKNKVDMYKYCIDLHNYTLGRATNISVSDCNITDSRCILMPGRNALLSVEFMPYVDVEQVYVRMYSVVSTVTVPLSLKTPDVCKDPNSGIQCPLTKDHKYKYNNTIVIHEGFPYFFLDIMLEFVNGGGEAIVCILIPVQIGTLSK
ncbi:PREDICTED: protein NPC2 homolog [Dinoponera quadriceps]|uniref:Protein NPC2 homolog n=1 Tax=Dinoponera quadriceps TaxID=609295 RepID=A0A6P3XW98_DINQU|nr:PREDICTED: protein NPC2 homolog [Dinoponera quadriceps]